MTDATIQVGVTGSREWTIGPQDCIRRGEFDIFSTPQLVALMERAAVEGMTPHLDDGQDSVGVRVDVTHSAASLLGQKVTATWTVVGVDRRRISFDIVVADETETIGQARHDRFVVDLAVLDQRLHTKRSSLS